MPSGNNKQSLADIDVGEYIVPFLQTVFTIGMAVFLIWFYFNVYKPEEKNYIKKTRMAYRALEQEARQLFRKDGFVFSEDDRVDRLCQTLAQRNTKDSYDCSVHRKKSLMRNFTFPKSKVTIYGMNSPAYSYGGTLVKDIVIDVDGEKGENVVGVDRTPVRIYSSGRMGGTLTPLNCNLEDARRLDFEYSDDVCKGVTNINFYDTKIPLAYNILQIGGKGGESRYVSRNVSYFRADCSAFGSDLLGLEEACKQKQFHWMTACYHDYYCAIELTKDN